MQSSLVSKGEGLSKMLEAVREFTQNEVLVGIPEDSSARGGDINNAQLLYIHTNGSPLMGIPARPLIEPAIETPENSAMIADAFKDGFVAALEGNSAGASMALESAGMLGQAAVQGHFTGANGWAANAGITIEGGWMRNKKSGKPFKVKGKGSNRPLIDTGNLRNAITYAVRRKTR